MTSADRSRGPGAGHAIGGRSPGRGELALPLLGLAILSGLFIHRYTLTARESVWEMTGATMGTTYRVLVDQPLGDGLEPRVRSAVHGSLEEVNRLMSSWDADSEITRFNRHRSPRPFPMSPPTLEVLALALDVARRSGGAFDPTVAPLVEALGFGPGAATAGPERGSRISPADPTAGHPIGFRHLTLDLVSGTLAKSEPRVSVDLSAIAKGYAVDRVADALSDVGVVSFLVEIGGELRASGLKRDGSTWRVGIETPSPGVRDIFLEMDLTDEAIATSGDYRNFREGAQGRFGHIVDPRSGRPVPWRGSSVTVLHERAAVADAWATALSVLGLEEGRAIAEREGLSVLFLRSGENGPASSASGGFRSRVRAARESWR